MLQEIDELIAALRSIDAPVEKVRAPGLSAAELEGRVGQLYDGYFVQHIDADVRAWFSWQHGASIRLIRQLRPPDDLWPSAATVSPGPFSIAQVGELIDGDLLEDRYLTGEIPFPSEPMFPIMTDGNAGLVYLRRMLPNDEWTVWLEHPDSGLSPAGRSSETAPTFRQWVTTLTARIYSGRVVVGVRGGLFVPEQLQERYDHNSKLHYYPMDVAERGHADRGRPAGRARRAAAKRRGQPRCRVTSMAMLR